MQRPQSSHHTPCDDRQQHFLVKVAITLRVMIGKKNWTVFVERRQDDRL